MIVVSVESSVEVKVSPYESVDENCDAKEPSPNHHPTLVFCSLPFQHGGVMGVAAQESLFSLVC